MSVQSILHRQGIQRPQPEFYDTTVSTPVFNTYTFDEWQSFTKQERKFLEICFRNKGKMSDDELRDLVMKQLDISKSCYHCHLCNIRHKVRAIREQRKANGQMS